MYVVDQAAFLLNNIDVDRSISGWIIWGVVSERLEGQK